ncbi:MAG TPA: putrescine aminotransferase [Phycisphaerales bacterium]|nr:putrescine aminotransferase [Phycisphaerales bacterium]
MASGIELSKDMNLYESYGRFISSSYPPFLNKLGLNKVAVKAQGATITDSDGKTYIDCVGGYGLFNLGHNNPEIIESLTHQLKEQQLFTKPLISEIQVRMAELIAKIAPGDLECSFILNSGSEAIDCAIKLARLHRGGKTIITAQKSFHGHTFGALTASGIPSFKRAFQPLLPGFISVPFGDIEALERSISLETGAVLIEPIQHEAGIFLPPDGYLQKVRKLCDEHNLIMILDEIKTGFGKTGRMFACEHYNVVPDILVLGKSLGGGLIPTGAVVAKSHLWKRFGLSFAMSASSYAGNVLACRAGISAIRYIQRVNLPADCAEKGKMLLRSFRDYVAEYPDILRSADGLGLLIGIETQSPRIALELAVEMIRRGVILVPAFGSSSVLMVEPPLVISFKQIRAVVDSFAAACVKVNGT